MLKRIFFNSLKFIFAFGLIYWLVKSDKLDMTLVKKTLANPMMLGLIICFMLMDNIVAALRWKLILQFKDKTKLSLLKVFRANWIGLFFNCVLPGAVSGDLIKIFYIKDENKNWSKKFLFASVFMDRVIGLFGLICVGAISCLISYGYLVDLSDSVKNLVHFNLFLFFIVITSFVMIIWFQNIPLFLSKIVKSKITFLAGILDKLENMWNDLCSFKHHLLSYLLISMFVQSVAIVIFWYVIAPFTNIPFELKHAATIFPIGMISIAIPISPAGLGVGHYVFDQLFSVLGFLNGASLFNIYFVIMIMTNLTGVIPYVLYSGKRISMKDVSEENI